MRPPIDDAAADATEVSCTPKAAPGTRLRSGPPSLVQRFGRRARAWLAALRLQFYPMTGIAYSVGALAALESLAPATYWGGLAALFLLEAATVLSNEYWDYESDQANENWGPFNGGSRVAVEGRIARSTLATVSWGLLGVFVLLALWLSLASPGSSGVVVAVLIVMAVLAVGYTVPPLKLSYRGLGELDVAFTHSLGVMLTGYVLQGGNWHDPLPWLLSVPLLLAVLPAITLSGIPDWAADRAAGKRTLAVRLGPQGAVTVALISTVAAALSGVAWWVFRVGSGLYGPAVLLAALHAGWLSRRLWIYRRSEQPPGRIDGLMVLALTLILWFGLLPLVGLLWPAPL